MGQSNRSKNPYMKGRYRILFLDHWHEVCFYSVGYPDCPHWIISNYAVCYLPLFCNSVLNWKKNKIKKEERRKKKIHQLYKIFLWRSTIHGVHQMEKWIKGAPQEMCAHQKHDPCNSIWSSNHWIKGQGVWKSHPACETSRFLYYSTPLTLPLEFFLASTY